MPPLKKVLGLRDVVLMNVVAIIGLRYLSLAAANGATAITLWIGALVFFFIPQAFAVIELTSRMPHEGGLYHWTKTTFGEFHGFMAGWCYWTNNLIYFPNLLIYVAGISVFTAGVGYQPLGEDARYVVLFSLVGLWLVAAFNIVGLSLGRWVQNVGGIGTWATAAVLVVLGLVALLRFGPANPMSLESLFTDLWTLDKLPLFAVICFAFAGLELAPILAGEVKDAERTIPRAIVLSGITIAVIYILGTVALLVALPVDEINIISGFLQGVSVIGERVGVGWLVNVLALLITAGGIGALMAWFTGAARMPFVAGVDDFLPKSFGAVHPQYGTPHIAILVQAAIATVFILMSFAGAGVEEAYLILLDTTLLVYFVPYLYMFAIYITLRWRGGEAHGGMRVPHSRGAALVVGVCGLLTTGLAMGLSLVPPEETASVLAYEAKIVGGFLSFLAVGVVLYLRKSA